MRSIIEVEGFDRLMTHISLFVYDDFHALMEKLIEIITKNKARPDIDFYFEEINSFLAMNIDPVGCFVLTPVNIKKIKELITISVNALRSILSDWDYGNPDLSIQYGGLLGVSDAFAINISNKKYRRKVIHSWY